MSAENEKLVTEFCNSFLGADMAKTVAYLAPNVVYHNMPWQPVTGHGAVREVLDPFIHGKNNCIEKMDIKNTTSAGNVVMNERVEHWAKGNVRVQLPVVGVFTFEKGKITKWCDYFDSGTSAPLMEAIKQAS